MDLISIVQSLWRHKRISIPLIVLTAIAALYVLEIKPPVYQASASVMLANPEVAATQGQIASDPSLKHANPNNTFVTYGDLTVVADAVMTLVTSPAAQPALLQAGADPRYQIALSTAAGNPPILNITGVGSTPQEAIKTADLVASATKTDLYGMQKKQGVDNFYAITAVDLVKPTVATRSTSGKLRSLIAVLGLGAVMLFVAVSVTDAIERRRMESSEKTVTPGTNGYSRARESVYARTRDSNSNVRSSRVR